jgi:hypothetical protein
MVSFTLTTGLALAALTTQVAAQIVPDWGQCGGDFWTGGITCNYGTSVCIRLNIDYMVRQF